MSLGKFSAEETVIHLSLALFGEAPRNTQFNALTAEVARIGDSALARNLANSLSTLSNAELATRVLSNLGISAATIGATGYAALEPALTTLFGAFGPNDRGQIILNLTRILDGLGNDAVYGAASKAWAATNLNAFNYSSSFGATTARPASELGGAGAFSLTATTAAGADVMRLLGSMNVRIDFTRNDNQVTGLDLDGDGVIEQNGRENVNPTALDDGKDFEIVDAYPRNKLNIFDVTQNFSGNIAYDGTGFSGDGVNTNGNIFLGGLGNDTALGGIGNDFFAGGGGSDNLQGGRNADFFFSEVSLLNNSEGNAQFINGGSTTDDSAVGNNTPQDSDWLLLEVSDDEDGTTINLSFEPQQRIETGAGRIAFMSEIEHIDASGNLYGFVDDVDVSLGADGKRVGTENVGIGSSAQLAITGSLANNILIGGYDNDRISGEAGNDILMGGNLKYAVNNPNATNIVNDGMDVLEGGNDNDSIVFEADKGTVDGGSGNDTLYLTNFTLGTRTATDMLADGVVRLDLLAQSRDASAGYGGADVNGTQDQTNYKTLTVGGRVTVTNMENVIATGMGAIDYKAAGTNKPELVFNNQQNQMAYTGSALDLRGSNDANVLYASSGKDTIEGRGGNDSLSGGSGNDDFVFGTADGTTVADQASYGDNVDVIHRQKDANGDNIWDTNAADVNLFERDFGLDTVTGTAASRLTVDFLTTDLAAPGVDVTSFDVTVAGTLLSGGSAATLAAFTTLNALAAHLNTTFSAQNSKVSVTVEGTKIVVTKSDGGVFGTTVATGTVIAGVATNGALQTVLATGADALPVSQDRLIFQSYEDRADGEKTDDSSVTGSSISLGVDSYAEDRVISFVDEDGNGMATTRIAEDQRYTIDISNVTTKDRVTLTVNGVTYTLTVGVDLDGQIIADEDGTGGDTQVGIQAAFAQRLTDFINSFNDDDTAAGKVSATNPALQLDGVTHRITLTQATYNGEQTVFMTRPTITSNNASGGEGARFTVTNTSDHEVEILDFDGRNGELNASNVLFLGETGTSRSVLATAKTAGQALAGSEAIIVDVGSDNLASVVFGTTRAIENNTASNSPLATVFAANGVALHGDDFLIGGAGNDTITGGTGDDRVEGSAGTDSVDGGKNYYAVQVLGETQARVYELNRWEAANPASVTALAGLTISSITLINQSEDGNTSASGVFDDTLQFSQSLFTPGVTRFTVTLDNFALSSGGAVQLRNDGAGTVGVDVDGNGTIDSTTTFTNFENIRTVSGSGNAVAGSGQGNDTLNVTALSATTTGAGGVSYNLTNGAGAGEVRISTGTIISGTNLGTALGDKPAAGDYNALVIKVDGVENVLGGTGADLLLIDETEAAKNNTFSAGTGIDRVIYTDDYDNGATLVNENILAQPTVTVKVATATDTDQVIMTGGRVGTTVATDTLVGVEHISLDGAVATSGRENDVLDVTTFTTGIVVDYSNGEVRTGAAAGSGVQVVIDGITQLERVNADGNDTVIVANAMTNAREDSNNGTPAQNILFMSYLDFDDRVTGGTARKSFAAQVADSSISTVLNQGLYTFALSEVGTDADVDRVDYSLETGRIAVPVGQGVFTTPGAATNRPQYVMVDHNNDGDLLDAGDRIDALLGVEEIVAARGVSILDFTTVGQDRQITFQYSLANAATPADKAVIENTIRIADGNGNTVAGLATFVERYTYDAPTSLLAPVADATWNRVEGSDAAEVIIYQGSENLTTQAGLDHRYTNDTLTLRGGNNEVRYSPLETSVTMTVTVTEENTATAAVAEGAIAATVTFQNGTGAALAGGGTHTITSHSADNSTSAGTLKVEGSQDAEDTVTFAAAGGQKTFVLGASAGVVQVSIGTAGTMTLTGFEILNDATSNDVYDFRSIATVLTAGLRLNEATANNDHDAIKVTNDAITFNGAGANTISLQSLAATVNGFNFDFDVLDVTNVGTVATPLVLVGRAAGGAPVLAGAANDTNNTDEVVLGALSRVASTTEFESVVLTDASVVAGAAFTFNPAADTLVQGSTTVSTTSDVLSFGGLVREQVAGVNSYVPNVATAVAVTVAGATGAEVHGGAGNDTITGSSGNDIFRGNRGNDTLAGGTAVGERAVITLPGGAASLAAGEVLTITRAGAAPGTLTIDGSGAPVSDLNLATATGDADQVGALLAAQTTAFFETELNYPAGSIASVSYNAASNELTIQFTVAAGNVDNISAAVSAGTMVPATVVTAPATNGSDTFIFEATAAANGADTINNFSSGATAGGGDVLNVSAFLGVAANYQGFTDGALALGTGTLPSGSVVVLYNKASLAASDISAVLTAGKLTLADNGKMVVLVSADVDGVADATNNPYLMYFVEDTDATAATSFRVTLVGTINSDAELAAISFVAANFS